MLLPPARMGNNGKRQLTACKGITEGIYRDSATEKSLFWQLETAVRSHIPIPQSAASERTVRIPDENLRGADQPLRSRLQYNHSYSALM